MKFIGPSFEVPPKNKVQKWKDFKEEISKIREDAIKTRQIEIRESIRIWRVQRDELRKKAENKDRMRLIAELDRLIEQTTKDLTSEDEKAWRVSSD